MKTSIRLPEELAEKLDKERESEDKNKSDIIREALWEYLEDGDHEENYNGVSHFLSVDEKKDELNILYCTKNIPHEDLEDDREGVKEMAKEIKEFYDENNE